MSDSAAEAKRLKAERMEPYAGADAEDVVEDDAKVSERGGERGGCDALLAFSIEIVERDRGTGGQRDREEERKRGREEERKRGREKERKRGREKERTRDRD